MESQQSPEQVGRWLNDSGLDRLVLEASDLPDGDERPRFSILKWQVENFSMGGLSGQAQFSFYNGQLMAVWFFPRSSEDLKKLASAQGLREGVTITTPGRRVRLDRDFRGNPYVSYEDERLVREMESWLKKYS